MSVFSFHNRSFFFEKFLVVLLISALSLSMVPLPLLAEDSVSDDQTQEQNSDDGATQEGDNNNASETETSEGESDAGTETTTGDESNTESGSDDTDDGSQLNGADGVDGNDAGAEAEDETVLVSGENAEEDGVNGGDTDGGENAGGTEDTSGDGETGDETTESGGTDDGEHTDAADTSDESTGDSGDGVDTGTDDGETPADDTEGTGGTDGVEGAGGASGENASENPEETLQPTAYDELPIPLKAENNIGEGIDDSFDNEDEEVTGQVWRNSRYNIDITTGTATAQAQVYSDANSINIESVYEGSFSDLDYFFFHATGSNSATIENNGMTFANSGDNRADADGVARITTGDAIAAVNMANVVNSSIVNSSGYIYLKNHVIEKGASLDLEGFFATNTESFLNETGTCNLLSCMAEDVLYTFSQNNTATITNDAILESVTGGNDAEGDYANIKTGNAYAGANIINVVNTNIVDSHYRLLTLNAIGDLEHDLILPTEELLTAFFARPNGPAHVTASEGSNDVHIEVDNENNADVDNNIEAQAESGENETNASDGSIKTGLAESESNILNKVNENVYGGDNLYLLIRVHGEWSGDVKGLPDGLDWMWTSEGIVIYNEDAEIAPSHVLPYDADTYRAHITDRNGAYITNNVHATAITGENTGTGFVSTIETGNAVASANVMNIANTNVVGANWVYAVVNIFGDFDGDVTFAQTDLTLTGTMNTIDDPLGPGSAITYEYTITNNSTMPATDVLLSHGLIGAYHDDDTSEKELYLGVLPPGESMSVSVDAYVDSEIPAGSSTEVSAIAVVESNEGDINESDNVSFLRGEAVRAADTNPDIDDDDSDSGDASEPSDSGGDDGAGDTNENEDNDDSGNETADSNQKPSKSSGGGGSSGGSSTKSIDREKKEIDPDSASHITVTKKANVPEDRVVSAGETVDYTIIVRNHGGNAYDVTVYDTLTNPAGSAVNEQSWELGTLLAGEEVKIEYSTQYKLNTPSGLYTNTAHVEAYAKEGLRASGGEQLKLDIAEYVIEIDGSPIGVGNVRVLAFFPNNTNRSVSALVSWETSRPAISQVFYSPSIISLPFNLYGYNYGYLMKSFKFPTEKTKHFMILTGLYRGFEYKYRIHAESDVGETFGGDYTFTVPKTVNALTLAI